MSPLDFLDESSLTVQAAPGQAAVKQKKQPQPYTRISESFLREIGYDPRQFAADIRNARRQHFAQAAANTAQSTAGASDKTASPIDKKQKEEDAPQPPLEDRKALLARLPLDMPAWKREKILRRHRDQTQGHWSPVKKLSREDMDKVRVLHSADPDTYSTRALSSTFKVSYEAIRRILHSKFVPTPERQRDMDTKRKEARIKWRQDIVSKERKQANASSADAPHPPPKSSKQSTPNR
ncbi:Required for respiratory growth protein 9 mitochondrial [Sorochytrium milnesiophthora]